MGSAELFSAFVKHAPSQSKFYIYIHFIGSNKNILYHYYKCINKQF